jgi:hypothetical protein
MYFLIHCPKRVRDARAIKGSIKEFVIQFAKHSIVEVENHIIPSNCHLLQMYIIFYKIKKKYMRVVFVFMMIKNPADGDVKRSICAIQWLDMSTS